MKFTDIKHENNTNITHSLGAYVFVTYLRDTANQKVNILMKTKIDINLKRKSEIKIHCLLNRLQDRRNNLKKQMTEAVIKTRS